MEDPCDILHAARHADPYPWYDRLRRGPPVQFEPATGVWVVCGATAVQAALRHPSLRVRPPSEPVPAALQGTPAGEVFARLARMNDGSAHAALRPHAEQPVARWTADAVEEAGAAAGLDLAPRTGADGWIHAVPAQAVARLLGAPRARLDDTVAAVQAFVRGIAPAASAEDHASALDAVQRLQAALASPGETAAALANRIGLMQQAVDATAGLLGNTLVRLHRRPELVDSDLMVVVRAVAREDPAIHHTRRWAAQPLELAGSPIDAGAPLVILLAGVASFGAGPHACPGEALSLRMAAAALRAVREAGWLSALIAPARGYRPLANARIPCFTDQLVRPL